MSILKMALKYPLALIMIGGGTLHFVAKDTYMRLMPPYVPFPQELLAVTGVIEAGLGVALLIPRTQKAAAWALIPTLVLVFPANVYGATSAGSNNPAMPGIPPLLAWLRLPLQIVLIVWAYWYTQDKAQSENRTLKEAKSRVAG